MEGRDPHVVTGLLKQYVRELPEPLMTYALYEPLTAAIGNCLFKLCFRLHLSFVWIGESDREKQQQELKNIFTKLPEENRNVLNYLLAFLKLVSEHRQYNKMGASNLAILFAPNILRPKVETVENMMTSIGSDVILDLIESGGLPGTLIQPQQPLPLPQSAALTIPPPLSLPAGVL